MKNKVETQQGITLIMLVVTIVVILILAGVSYHLVIGNNGIISKAEEAGVITRAGQVEEEVALWKSDTYIADHTNATSETESEMIERLRSHKFITEDDEVDTIGKVIKIKKKDGTVVKEIPYSNVVINIKKTPETGNTNYALLEVTSVEGLEPIGINIKMETPGDENKLRAMIQQMNINSKIELCKELYIKVLNKQEGTEFRNFTELFNIYKETDPDFPYETEADFDNEIKENPEEMMLYIKDLLFKLYYNEETHELKTYEIIDPEGEVSDSYIATENGTYIFKVRNFITDEVYSKTIEVNNIGGEYVVSRFGFGEHGLASKENNTPTDFDRAYVVYNNQPIEIGLYYLEGPNYRYLNDVNIAKTLAEYGNLSWPEYYDSWQEIIIIKEGEYYYGKIKLEFPL